MTQEGELLVRADAGPRIGAGHVMRCLALAQAWQDGGGTARLLSASLPDALASRLEAEGFPLERLAVEPGSAADARETVAWARRHHASWVVVDGYHFDASYQRAVKQAGFALLLIDDNAQAEHYMADLVLNQNLHAEEAAYTHRAAETQLLLGSPFVLLRREFQSWCGWQRAIPERAGRLLVSLGGGAVGHITAKVLQGVEAAGVEGLEVVVVGRTPGDERPHAAGIRFESGVDDMARLMARADVAVGAAGATAWERAFLGLPSLAVVLAENQRPVALRLAEVGAAIDLGWHESLDTQAIAGQLRRLVDNAPLRREMSRRGRRLVDGEGAQRVVMRLLHQPIRLRDARPGDCRLLWQWANEPGVRAASFSSQPIAWEEHQAWYGAKRSDPNCRLWVAVDAADEPIGQIRFEECDKEPTLSVSIAAGHRAQGYGRLLIEAGARQFIREFGPRKIHAFIRPGNAVSLRAFAGAGFENVGDTQVRGCPALHWRRAEES